LLSGEKKIGKNGKHQQRVVEGTKEKKNNLVLKMGAEIQRDEASVGLYSPRLRLVPRFESSGDGL
jgi:hypothetical protein